MGIGVVAQSVTTSIFGTTAGTSLNWALLALTKGAMHGAAQGFIQGISGGNAGQSFITAMATSIAGDAFGAIGGKANSIVGQSLFGALAGGVTSRLQGGNFWEGAAIGLTVGLLNHAGKKLSEAIDGMLKSKPKVNYKKYFSSLLKQSLTAGASDLVAFSITRQYRHLFGPDAIAVSGNGAAGVGAGFKLEKGALFVVKGYDAGQIYGYDDIGFGAFTASASVGISITKLYYSGNVNFYHTAFMGNRSEFNLGVDVGPSIGITGIYAPSTNNNFVIGFGMSFGFGGSLTIIDFNLNGGITSRSTPWKK